MLVSMSLTSVCFSSSTCRMFNVLVCPHNSNYVSTSLPGMRDSESATMLAFPLMWDMVKVN